MIYELSIANCQALLITAYRLGQPEIQGIANEGMPDRHLIEVRYVLSKIGKVIQTEVVTRIEAQTKLLRRMSSLHIGRYGRFPACSIPCRIRLGV